MPLSYVDCSQTKIMINAPRRDKNLPSRRKKKKMMRVFERNATTLNALKGFSEPRVIVLKMLLL